MPAPRPGNFLQLQQASTSIIVGAAIGTAFFKERFGIPRIAAAGLMVIGIGLMLQTS
ncbi:hypothetical protein [Streptomyces niveus]|uniref:hypothetical protein n=1 Tax=Streptomyces niveus TaxID=193462 RepID=UPI001331AC72|nr:hypothetical protein [Streptomyces niveus]